MNLQADTEVRKNAENYFSSGLYCAESVVLAIAKELKVESAILPKMATAFCSGMSQTCSTCGALTGAIMGVSLAYGRSTPDQPVESVYHTTRQLIQEFKQEFGDINCKNLLGGCDLGTLEGQAMFAELNLNDRCLKMTGKAAEIAARLIQVNRGETKKN